MQGQQFFIGAKQSEVLQSLSYKTLIKVYEALSNDQYQNLNNLNARPSLRWMGAVDFGIRQSYMNLVANLICSKAGG